MLGRRNEPLLDVAIFARNLKVKRERERDMKYSEGKLNQITCAFIMGGVSYETEKEIKYIEYIKFVKIKIIFYMT